MKPGDALHGTLWDLAQAIQTTMDRYGVFEAIEADRKTNKWYRRTSAILRDEGIDQNEIILGITRDESFVVTVDALKTRFNLSDEDAERNVTTFMTSFLEKADNRFTPKVLAETVSLFMNELSGNPIRYDIHAALEGVILHPDVTCVFTDGTKLIPDLKDQVFDSLIELTITGNLIDAQDKLITVLHILRLYRLAVVCAFEGYFVPASFFNKSVRMSQQVCEVIYHYDVTQADIENLKAFYERMMPLVQNSFQNQKHKYICVALERYGDALVRPGLWAQRITLAITSLEALLLKPKERVGLSRRLGQRLVILLSKFDYKPSETYDSIIHAYDVRSTYIHGGVAEEDAGLEDLCTDILEITRACIVILLQMLDQDKNKIVALLDKAMIDLKFRTIVDGMVEFVVLEREYYGDTKQSPQE